MEKVSNSAANLDFDKLQDIANERLKSALKEYGLTYPVIAEVIDMKLPTFQDKISGRSSWYIEEWAKLCCYLNKTSDELLFGNALFVTEWNFHQQHDMKLKLKNILTKQKNYKLLGKLTAEGFFNE